MNPFFLFQYAYSSQFSDRIVENILTKLLSMVDNGEVTLLLNEKIKKIIPFKRQDTDLIIDTHLDSYDDFEFNNDCRPHFDIFKLEDPIAFTFEPGTFTKIYKLLTGDNKEKVILYNVKQNVFDYSGHEYEDYSGINHQNCRTNFVSRLNEVSKLVNGPKFNYLGDIQDTTSLYRIKYYNNIVWDSLCNKAENASNKIEIGLTVDDHIYYLFCINISNIDYPAIYQEHLKEIYSELSYDSYEDFLSNYYKDDFQAISKFLAHFDIGKFSLRFLLKNQEDNFTQRYFQHKFYEVYDRILKIIEKEMGNDFGYDIVKMFNLNPDNFAYKASVKFQQYKVIIRKFKSIGFKRLKDILITMPLFSDYDLLAQVIHQFLNNEQRGEKCIFIKLIYQSVYTFDQNERDWLANYKEPELNAENKSRILEIYFKIINIDKTMEHDLDNINLVIFIYFEIQNYLEKCKEENISCELLNDFENLNYYRASNTVTNSNVFSKALVLINTPLKNYSLDFAQDKQAVINNISDKLKFILSNNGLEKANERKELRSRHENPKVEELDLVGKLFFKLDKLNEKTKANLDLDFQDVKGDVSN